ncbi:hypothetical protein [Vibrio phage TCU_VP01_ZB]
MSEHKVTQELVESKVKSEQYVVVPGTTLTFCVLTLENGFTVTGESACVDPENFDKAVGEHWAKVDAMKKVWPLEAYLMKQKLYEAELEKERTFLAMAVRGEAQRSETKQAEHNAVYGG